MGFDNITITVAKYEVDALVRAEVSKHFPNHVVHKITPVPDGGVQVELKYNHGSYMDR